MRTDFASLPLQAQCVELERALAGGEDLQVLLGQCSVLSDPTPLAWLCARPGLLEEYTELLAARLTQWPETSLLKVLKGLPAQPALEKLLRIALRQVGLDRLAVLAMLERSLKHLWPDSYEEYLGEIEADLPSDRALALLPARALKHLDGSARARRAQLARQALEQLGRAPKAVSLSHAEELLSKRVYTQPGHFLFELLQNAEDAQARTFRVRFEIDQVVIWHDGLPFDVRDLVGVTSIGQTTKKKQQIGFFGVGFKSVYEVTDRPQIYSDVFCFEIIDVSIPRALERPAEVSEHGTTLILPLKKAFPELPQIARQLDAGVLLTLTHLRQIDLGQGWVIERVGNQINSQKFLIDESDHTYRGPERESGRPTSTRLLVAIPLNDLGRAVPPAQGAPTVYSYLPTSQPSGLRFLIHSHFDVPVDRERIHPESAWNRWILDQVPAALGRLAQGTDLLEVLPLPGEPSGLFAFLPRALTPILRPLACLPGGLRPDQARLATAEMVALQLEIPLWAPSGRVREVAEHTLGCATFGTLELIEYLENHPPSHNFEAIYALLLADLDLHRDRLQQLAIVPDASGQLKAPARLALAGPELRRLYPPDKVVAAELDASVYLARLGCQRLGAQDLLSDLQQGMPLLDAELVLQVMAVAGSAVREQATQLPLFLAQDGRRYRLARAGDWGGAARAIHPGLAAFYTGRRPLLAADYPDWPVQELDWSALALDLVDGRLSQIPHDLLEEGYRHVAEVLLQRLAALPLWPDQPLCGALRADHPQLPAFFPKQRFVGADLAQLAHVQALLPHTLKIEALLELPDLRPALGFLSDHASEVSTGAAARWLVTGSLPDESGRLVAVSGLMRPQSDELRALYREGLERPFVSSAGQRLLECLGLLERLPRAGTAELLDDLSQCKLSPDHAREVVSFLAARAGELSRAEAQRCLALPLFPQQPLGGSQLVPSIATVWLVEKPLQPLLQQAGWNLLEEGLCEPVEELMAAALRQPAGIREVLDLYGRLGGLGSWLPGTSQRLIETPALLRLLACLVDSKPALVGYAELSQLRIWPTVSGARLAAAEVADLQPLRSLGPWPEVELVPQAWRYFLAMEPLLRPRPAVELLRQKVDEEALDGIPLSQQPKFLSTAAQIQTIAALLNGTPLVDGNGCLRRQPLLSCDALTLSLLPRSALAEVCTLEAAGLKPLPAERVIGALVGLEPRHWKADPALRQRFYEWLLARQGEIFSSPACRRLLTEHPLWLSQQKRLLAARELVLEEGVPELGVDWHPHSEIPLALCEVLQRQLGVGKLRAQEVLESHLLPAYRQAAQSGDRPRAEALFAYLAENLADRPGLLGGDFPLQDRSGRFRPAREVVWPDPELDLEALFSDTLLAEHYSPTQLRFVRALGLAELPPLDKIQAVFQGPRRTATAVALARLLAGLYRRQGEEVLQRIPAYRTSSWLPDALGAPRPATQLFVPGGELEALIGTHGRLYPDPVIADILGEELLLRLGLRDAAQIKIDEVLDHLKQCSAAGLAISFRVYQWLEKGQLGDIKGRLSTIKWVYSDDGLWFSHRQVLGTHAFTLFGNRRGYWERGFLACPQLCRLFDIPGTVSADVVGQFLVEVAADVRRLGDRELLSREKPLTRMLLACYTHVTTLDRKLPIILAQSRPGNEKRLLPADHPALVSSDTPSLEKLFESAGTFYVALPGSAEQRQAVEAFHAAVGIRSLRDAFTISLDGGGRERTVECAGGVARLRLALRSLLAVLPRIRRQRDQLTRLGWLDQERLKPLVMTGSIRVIEGLKVAYELAGVGIARVQAPGAYNPAKGELLVDLGLAARADAPLTGLAQGLVPCIYQGPGEEQLVDILEILLPLDSRERMDAYLDARHFPAVNSGADRLGERLGEVLDYGLEQPLLERFPELSDVSAWAEVDALAGCEGPAQAVQQLLARAGVADPSPELRQAVSELFTAPTLDRPALPVAAPASLPETTPPPPPAPEAPPAEGLLSRVKNWLMGSAVVQDAIAGGNPYQPQAAIHSQFRGTRERLEKASNRPPVSGLFHQPTQLPRPHIYAAHLLAGTFEAANQRWLPVQPAELTSFYAGQPTGRLIPFQGTLQPGVSRLPLPFYSRLHGDLLGAGKVRLERGTLGEVKVHASAAVTVRFQVEILAPPRLSQEPLKGVKESWLRPTQRDLPREVVSWLSSVRKLAAWERALAAQEFMQTRYAYDPDFLSHPEAQRVLKSLPPGEGNHTLRVLHARREQAHLGHGICTELNTMLCELLRHLEVPSMLASGWVLDEGFLEFPDHTFAVAVLNSLQGPCLMPLDAANSTQGPLRPLGRRQPPSGPLPPMAALPSPPGAWSATGSLRPVDGLENLRQSETQLRREELDGLGEAVLMVMEWRGLTAGAQLRAALSGQLPEGERLQVLQQALRQQLPSAEVAAALLRLLAGDYARLTTLPPAVTELVSLGLAEVRSVPVLQVLPRRSRDGA